MHPGGTDLELDRMLFNGDRGMEGLVAIGQGRPDVVADLGGDGRPARVERVHGQVARAGILDDDVKAQEGRDPVLRQRSRVELLLLETTIHVVHPARVGLHARGDGDDLGYWC